MESSKARLRVRSAIVALMCVIAAGLTGCRALGPSVRTPVAVVLVQTARGSELATIDLARMRLVRRVRLRSLCLSIDGSSLRRLVATAQCGGPDRSADNAVGLYRPGERRVRYVGLGIPNPLDVAVAGPRALVIHGFEQDGELVTSLLDLDRLRLMGRGRVGALALEPARQTGRLLVPVPRPHSGEASRGAPPQCAIVEVDRDGSTSVAQTVSAASAVVVSADGATSREGWVLYTTGTPADSGRSALTRWAIRRIGSPGEHGGRAAVVGPLEHTVEAACEWGQHVAICDADGVDMSDPGDRVLVVEPVSGQVVRTLRLEGGMPAALATWRGHLLVVDGVSGDLVVFGPRSSQPVARIRLDGVPVGSGDVVVFP